MVEWLGNLLTGICRFPIRFRSGETLKGNILFLWVPTPSFFHITTFLLSACVSAVHTHHRWACANVTTSGWLSSLLQLSCDQQLGAAPTDSVLPAWLLRQVWDSYVVLAGSELKDVLFLPLYFASLGPK